MATFKFLLRSNADKPVTIELRFINGLETCISLRTGFVIHPKQWDKNARLPLDNLKNKELRNNLIKLKEFLFASFNKANASSTVMDRAWLQTKVDDFFDRKKQNKMEKFIVAEINKTWNGNFDENTPRSELIRHKFEDVINVNYNRGYILQGWQFSNAYNLDRLELNETIIAVFVRDKDYIITTKGTQKSITCLDCEKTSYNTNDIENLYCGHCYKFHVTTPLHATKRIKLNHGTATVDINCPQKTIDLLNELSNKAYNMNPKK